MLKKYFIIATFVLAAMPAYGQGGLQHVLESVEQNNLSLRAAGYDAEAKSYEARTGNSLDNLSVSYGHLWGNPSELGTTAELEISQSFEFPTVYAARSRRAQNLAGQFSNEVLSQRQQILLEAKEIYLELCMLHKTRGLAASRLTSAEHVAALSERKFERGDATIVDKNRTGFERMSAHEAMLDIDRRILTLENRLAVLNGGAKLEYRPEEILPEALSPFEQTLSDYERLDPTLASFRLREEGAAYDLRVSRSMALPKFELGYKHEYGPGEKFNGVTAGLSIPVFSNRFNVKRAKAAQQAAVLDSEAALAENRAALEELYQRAVLLRNAMESFSELPSPEDYASILSRLLESGEINIVDYYSELDAYYNAMESHLRISLEYDLTAARINMVYL